MLEGQIKASKDADFHLVSFEKNEKKLPNGVGAQGQVNLAKQA